MDKIEITDAMTGCEIVELGFGLIARGLFRINESEGLQDAINEAWHVVEQSRLVALDFVKLNEKAKKPDSQSSQETASTHSEA